MTRKTIDDIRGRKLGDMSAAERVVFDETYAERPDWPLSSERKSVMPARWPV